LLLCGSALSFMGGLLSAAQTRHEVDVAVFGRDDQGREELLAIGDAKWNEVVGAGHLRRLIRIRTLLGARTGIRSDRCRLLLFSGAGFTGELQAAAAADTGIRLVDLDVLYGVS
jgi:hypothetical protein